MGVVEIIYFGVMPVQPEITPPSRHRIHHVNNSTIPCIASKGVFV